MKKNYLFLLVLITINLFALQSCQTTNVSDVQNEKEWKEERLKELEKEDCYLIELEITKKKLSNYYRFLLFDDLGTSLSNTSNMINKYGEPNQPFNSLERLKTKQKINEIKQLIAEEKKKIKSRVDKEYQIKLENER